MIKTFNLAGMIDVNKIQYSITPEAEISLDMIKMFEGDRELNILSLSAGNDEGTGVIELGESLDISKAYRVVIDGYGEKTVVPTDIFDTKYFIDNFTYDESDLGAIINGDSTTFKLWAPTASKVTLNLFSSGHEGEAYKSVDMLRGDRGVWSYTENCGHGTYYTYTVTTAVGTNDAVDPYAKSCGLNGERGMVVDLTKTNPHGWENHIFENSIKSYSDVIIWEVHVRDFSNKIADSKYRGKYLAFTERGLVNEHGEAVGVDYLANLGITHVHLLPVYDYATVDEANPDSEFNWGYDPKNYDTPEGSYSTDPFSGEVRIREYKQMVMGLHNAGIAVVMDMVYNHTYSAHSSFSKIVPYYYYRFTSSGENVSESGCGNDTASERYMYGKFMVDSTRYWVKEYKLDGLRFDLMGMHDLATMQRVENAVHTVNPKAIIYGEGWDMGKTIDGSARATQKEISKIQPVDGAIGGIAVFNDVIRDGLKGSVFIDDSQGYISGDGSKSFPAVLFGIRGGRGNEDGWNVENAMVVNYMSAHDNNTLWDKLAMSNPDDSAEVRAAMNRIGATMLMISKGAVFFQAGEEMLRSKPMGDGKFDENSYKSSDEINNIRWDALKSDSIEKQMSLFYKGLIEMRKAYPIFTDNDSKVLGDTLSDTKGKAYVTVESNTGDKALVLINPTAEAMTYSLDSTWNMVCDGSKAGSEVIEVVSGEISVPSYSALVLVSK